MSRKLLIRLLILGAAAVAAIPAGAAEGAGAEDDDARPSFVEYVEVNVSELPSSNTIATKLPVELQMTPANVGSVSSALFREQDAQVLGDALRNISGLNVQAGPAVHDFFTIRGFDSLSSGLVLTDGASEPEATFYQLYNIEGVEVLKGPAGFLYGSNPLAGTVNLVRKQPLPGNFSVIRGRYGSNSTYEGTLDWNVSSDEADRAFRLNAIWNESDRYRDEKDSEYSAVNPSFTWKPTERSTFNFNLEAASAEFRPDSGLPLDDPDGSGLRIPDVPRKRSYQSPVEFSEQDIGRFQFNYEYRAGDSLKLRNKLYYSSLEWDSAGSLFNGTVDLGGGPQVLRTLTTLDDEQEFVGNQFEAIWSVATGSVEHNLLTGLEVARYTDEFALSFLPPQFSTFPCDPSAPGMPCIDLYDPVETFTMLPDEDAFTPLGAGDARSTVIAPYVVDQIKFSEMFQLFVGARYDDIDFEDDVSGFSRDDSELSPMAGLVVAPDATLTFYANASQAHSPASPRVQAADPTGLEPEESTQFEVGVKKKFLGEQETTLAVYDIERENIAIPDATAFLLQAGDQESRGVEIEIAAEPARRLRTFFSYAYNDSELTSFTERDPSTGMVIDRSGNDSPYAPEHLVNLWVSRDFENGLGVAAGGRYFSDQFFAADNAYEVDGAVIFDAAVFYDFEAWRFALNGKNLADEDYETGSFASTSVVPGDGRTVYGSVEYRF